MWYMKALGALLVVCVVVCLFVIEASNALFIGILLVVVFGLTALSVVLVGFVVYEKIDERKARIALRRLEVVKENEIVEAMRTTRELQAFQVQQEYKLRERAESLIHFSKNNVLVHHNSEGGLDVAYVPMERLINRVTAIDEVEEVEMLAAPQPQHALSLVRNGLTDEIVLGSDNTGRLISFAWKKLKSVLILGLSGGGKSTTAAWLVIQAVLQGGKVALIDKHAKTEDESLYSKLRPFEQAFYTPVGDSPQAAMRVLSQVRAELEKRLTGAESSVPLLLVVDEFTALLRQRGNNEAWSEVADKLAGLVEDINTEGRKVKVYAVCIGQAGNASRTGGTEVRELFHTRIYHTMREQQARLLGMTENKKAIKGLAQGQVLVDMEGQEEPLTLAIPYLPDEDIPTIASLIRARAFMYSSLPVREDVQMIGSPDVRTGVNEPVEPSERVRDRVLTLRKQGESKENIILEVWQAKKGGSEKYKQANREYEAILAGASEIAS